MTETTEAVLRDDAPLTVGERISDRVNPILVREITQALKGRVFMMTLAGSVLAIVLLTFFNVWFEDNQSVIGRQAFTNALMCLAPIVLFVVPMQAFLSMRQEVSGGTTEQLMLTHLTPRRIVLGKLAASFVQFVLFLAVFAPVLALTFLLRGVDVPTIALMLFFAALASLTATVVSVALAAVGRFKTVGSLMQALASLALFTATAFGIGGAWELPREIGRMIRSDESWMILSTIVAAFLAVIVLFGMIASATLAHSYENRSTSFRAFAVGASLVLFGLLAWTVPSGWIDEVIPVAAAFLAIFSMPIWLYACCEETALSPRVRTLVPKNRTLAWLAVPLLPGGGRGLLFTWVLGALILALATVLPFLITGSWPGDELGLAGMAWCYAVIYGAVGRGIRSRLPAGSSRSFAAFVGTLLVLVVVSLGPLFLDLLLRRGRSDWSPLHVFNPFYTIGDNEHWPEHSGILLALGITALIVMGLCARRVRADTREVLAAAAARRQLAAAAVPAAEAPDAA